MPVWRKIRQEFVHDLETDLSMGHFAPSEFEGHFDLHILAQEIHGMLDFYAEIMRIDLRAELDFLDFVRVLMLLGFLVPLGLLVTVLAKVHQAANWRGGVRGNLNQVHRVGARQVQGVPEAQNPELIAIHSDNPDLAGTYFPVYSNERSGRRRRT